MYNSVILLRNEDSATPLWDAWPEAPGRRERAVVSEDSTPLRCARLNMAVSYCAGTGGSEEEAPAIGGGIARARISPPGPPEAEAAAAPGRPLLSVFPDPAAQRGGRVIPALAGPCF